ncbi:uncharacterized protein LOC116445994 [Corvus moneduloides]|uniref:uncharacterized protein LOC116445994 n=1 Tax=Corvus moneduloides TaxID=1196302 RepID=UPI00136266D8|nr:uncharacterized protein LOC116445994 [Corvus moneduloides]
MRAGLHALRAAALWAHPVLQLRAPSALPRLRRHRDTELDRDHDRDSDRDSDRDRPCGTGCRGFSRRLSRQERRPLCRERQWRMRKPGLLRRKMRRCGRMETAATKGWGRHRSRQESLVPSQDFTGGSSAPWELLEEQKSEEMGMLPAITEMWEQPSSSEECAKNIQNCLLTLMDSRNAFHSSCFGMGMAVGSSGRSTWRPAVGLLWLLLEDMGCDKGIGPRWITAGLWKFPALGGCGALG